MSKPNPNEIGIVTVDISNGKVSGPFVSPLSPSKGMRTKLYIPRFKPIMRGNNLLPALQRYIGIDKVGLLNKKKWVENAHHLFMDRAAVETFLKKYTASTPSNTQNPDTIKANADFIIKEIYFPKNSLFRYNGKLWTIKNITDVSCKYMDQAQGKTLLVKYKNREFKKLRVEYEKALDRETKGLTNPDVIKSVKSQLDKEFTPKFDTLREDVDKYDIKKPTAENKVITDELDKIKKHMELVSPVLCKIKLDLKEYTKLIPTKKKVKDDFTAFQKSCRKGDKTRSTKQGEIIKTCRELCNSGKHPKWCKSCAVVVNCLLEPTYTINSGPVSKAATAIQTLQRGRTTRKKTTAKKKKVTVGPATSKTGGKRTRWH